MSQCLALLGNAGVTSTVDAVRQADGYQPSDQAARDRAQSLHRGALLLGRSATFGRVTEVRAVPVVHAAAVPGAACEQENGQKDDRDIHVGVSPVRAVTCSKMEKSLSPNSETPSPNSESLLISLLRRLAKPGAAVAHMPRLLVIAAGKAEWGGGNVKIMLARAARRCGLKYSRAKAIFYREAARIDAEELIRAVLAAGPTPSELRAIQDQIDGTDQILHALVADRDGVDAEQDRGGSETHGGSIRPLGKGRRPAR